MVKNLPAIRETRVSSLDQEGPLEKEMTTHSSILAWRIPQTEELGGLQSMGWQRVGHNWEVNISECLEGWYLFLQFGYRCNKTYTMTFLQAVRLCALAQGSESTVSTYNGILLSLKRRRKSHHLQQYGWTWRTLLLLSCFSRVRFCATP